MKKLVCGIVRSKPLSCAAALCLLFASCVSAHSDKAEVLNTRTKSPANAATDISDTFVGSGQAETVYKAVVQAKIDAVRTMVQALVGKDVAEKNAGKLQQTLYSTTNADQFVLNNTLVITRRDSVGSPLAPLFAVELSITLNRAAIVRSLIAQGLSVANPDGAPPPAAVTTSIPGNRPSYMLSFGDQTNEKDPLLLQEALSQATAYLTSNGYAAIDPAQVVARGLGVDLAVVIDARMFCETRGRNYYAQATITAHIFEAATGHLEGVQSFNGPETLSKVDEADAVCNALLSGVCALMQLVVQQPKNLLSAPAHGGI